MGFNEIIGQNGAIKILKEELRDNRINHAYLFNGRDGVGKKLLAFQFARAINCHNKVDDSCGQCMACKKIDHFNHPDLKLIEPVNNSIKIDQIRNFQKEIVYKPYESKKKIYIIDGADTMTLEAANSLLKTLEEPPHYAVIILLVEDLNKLPSTIISRCQQIQLSNIAREIIKEYLINKGIGDKKAHLIATLARGSIGDALKLVEKEDILLIREELFDFLCNLTHLRAVDIFNKSQQMVDWFQQDLPLFDLISGWFKDIIFYNQGIKDNIVNYDFIDKIEVQARNYRTEELISIIELIGETRKYIKANVRKDLALQVMLLKIRAKRV
ncbi:DNA polymerase III subunit delta' [Halothermothrix orenii]|uniref:DNA polymerase III subunit delta' n=1 Tax=Halothermothrix orenii (strain H 168 / OCM 544 / DSM 9562) TaxID=373903 RepID=B8CZS9_HALOH|nr:DNA polymerase III subunit delta' [Halothermothrix orenii]ACL70781.1 DNA polymerase III, delta prime subunit [Halothermothrix orenii H 168]